MIPLLFLNTGHSCTGSAIFPCLTLCVLVWKPSGASSVRAAHANMSGMEPMARPRIFQASKENAFAQTMLVFLAVPSTQSCIATRRRTCQREKHVAGVCVPTLEVLST